jgi:hypothetical protein
VTFRDERKMRVLENRMLRKIFGPQRDEAIWEWRTLYNEKLHDQSSSPTIVQVIISRRMRWVGHVDRRGTDL